MTTIENNFIKENFLLTQENIFIENIQQRETLLMKKFNGYLNSFSMNFSKIQWSHLYKSKPFLTIYNLVKKYHNGKFSLFKKSHVLFNNFKTLLKYTGNPSINESFIENYCNFLQKINDENLADTKKFFDVLVIDDNFINNFLNNVYPTFMNKSIID